MVNYCEEGFVSTGQDIHSHLDATRFRPNELDLLWAPRRYGPNEFMFLRSDYFTDADIAGVADIDGLSPCVIGKIL